MAPAESRLPVSTFERLLLRGDSASLFTYGYEDTASVAKGDFDIFLSSEHAHHRSAKIAQQCIQTSATEVTLQSVELSSAFAEASAGSTDALFSCYTAGVALLQAFVRENWAGPASNDHDHDADASETAGFFLAVDGEDVARPAHSLHWLRAAKLILVDSVIEFVRNGAQLAPWWATRALLAHQSVLSSPTPTLKYNIFSMYGRFLGTEAAETRYLFDTKPSQKDTENEEDSDDDSLLPAPVAEGDDQIHDEEADFSDVFDETQPTDRTLLSLALLELSMAQKLFYDGDGALRSLNKACRLTGVAFRVAGEMGVRTKFQTKATAQMLARAFELSTSQPELISSNTETVVAITFPALSRDKEGSSRNASEKEAHSTVAARPPLPKNVPLNDSDMLGYIKLTEDQRGRSEKSEFSDNESDNGDTDAELGDELEHLTPLRQALALCHAAVVRARNASHTLTKEEMAPYVDLVLRNAGGPFGTSSVVQIRALMLRVSFERDRGRYLERCMSQMEEIGKFVDNPLSSEDLEYRITAAGERNFFTFASALPPRWELKKELAISFGKIGLVKSAMEIFENLEYWDELVDCHRLIGNLGAAEALIREQLDLLDAAILDDGVLNDEGADMIRAKLGASRAAQARAARRPRLLCVLGDVSRNREYFETAWKESECRYARAKRALGRMCVEAEEWAEAVGHFREALEINALFPEVWFTYGCAAIETKDMQTAANAFTRVVQQAPENGEAWNNLGRVLHDMGKKKQALSAFSEAAKIKRDSWRVWSNVLILAVELRSSLDIVRAMERLLEIRGKEGVVAEALGIAVAEVIRMSGSTDIEDKALVGPVTRRLLKVLGRCTALVSTNPSIWAAYAELHELVPGAGGKQKAFDCRLKQVRSLSAQGIWKSEIQAFRHMAMASDALVRDAIASENALSVRAADIHVQSVIEQTKDDFQQDEGFARLTEVELRLRARSSNESPE